MENEFVREAMNLMYGPILTSWSNKPQDPTALLLRLLASVVYHFSWIEKMAQLTTDHPFNAVPLIFKPELVAELKKIVTTESSLVIHDATGIPPHVEHSIKLQKLLQIADECLNLLQNHVVDVKQVRNCLQLQIKVKA